MQAYCSAVGIDYEESMLTWKPMTDEEINEFGGDMSPLYGKVLSTTTFTTDESTTEYTDLPLIIQDTVKRALPLYNQLSQHKIRIE